MSPDRKETPFERRIRELEEEASQLQRNIKTINKAIDRGNFDELRTLTAPRAEPARLPPPRMAVATVPAAPASAAPFPAAAPPASVAATGAAPMPAAAVGPMSPPPADEGSAWRAMPRVQASTPPIRGNERFASYLSSGSFGKSRPVGAARRVQRNKAIFALVMTVILSFILYKLLT